MPQSASGPGFPLPTIFQELPGYPSALEIDETLMPAVLRGLATSDLPGREAIAHTLAQLGTWGELSADFLS